MWPLTLLLAVLLGLFLMRFLFSQPPQLRCKAGESEAEARLILQGAYRVYTWTTWVVVLASLAELIQQAPLPPWLWAVLSVLQLLWLILARAVYWRLGYDLRRIIFLLGHLTLLFPLSEVIWSLPRDLQALLSQTEQKSA